ncbi:MAG: hypothetical protein Q7R40_18465 [Phaeospirillum sp.]|nr:hypothetical protein [Phaeospirillum sp.]
MGKFNGVFLAWYVLQSICAYLIVNIFADGACLGCESLNIYIPYISKSIQRIAGDNGIVFGCSAVVVLFEFIASLAYGIVVILIFGKSGLSDGGDPTNNALFMIIL